MARLVLATLGTLGDLHPAIAVARALADRGHHAIIATHPGYRPRVEAAGLPFHPTRPDFPAEGDMVDVMRQAMDERTGSEYVLKTMVLPHLRDTYADLSAACEGADAIVTHTLSFAGQLVAEARRLPRIGMVLQPMSMLSSYDPPVGPGLMASRWFRTRGPALWKVLWWLARASTRGWFREVDTMRRELALPATPLHPLFNAHSPLLNLAMFPAVLSPPQPDWPPNTVVTGLCLYDRDEQGRGMPEPLSRFLDAGPAPVVFTLGSSGVWDTAGFYAKAAAAATSIGRRAVLLVGPQPDAAAATLPDTVIAVDYAPHSELMARAAAVVHHGGVGTTGQALRAGHPMVVVPFSHDQPDNAARCERLGIARVVARRRVTAERLAAALRGVLDDPAVAVRAAAIGEQVRAERGASAAADAIERVLIVRPA